MFSKKNSKRITTRLLFLIQGKITKIKNTL